ncbi:MAG TPA: extracellular solute-binding protein [Chloroflexota bacterium]|jgi:iron(III) transport system substrate-binding protein
MTFDKRALGLLLSLCILACAPAAAPAREPSGQPAAGAAAGASSAPPSDPAMAALDQLYPLAQQEGKVVHYTVTPSQFDGAKAAFQKRYPGVSVEIAGMRGPEMVSRANAENASGQHVADVLSTGLTTMAELARGGFFIRWEPPDADKLLPDSSFDDGTHWMYELNVYGALVNTRLVPADKLPTKRADLLDPFWRGDGKLLLDDPRTQGGGQSFMVISYRDEGRGFLEQLAAQKPTWSRDRQNGPVQVARGEFAAYVPQNVGEDIAKLEKGGPVKLVFLQDGTYYTQITAGIFAGAPHPNAARLWAGYLYTEEAQRALAEDSLAYAVLPGIPGPKGYPPLDQFKLRTRTPEERERTSEFVKVFDEVLFR